MVDVSAAFGAFTQGQGALELAPAARSFRVSPGALSGFRLLDAAASVIGVDRISGQLASYATKVALRSNHAAEEGAARMVEAMRARVPRDTGALYSGIEWSVEGGRVYVQASSARYDSSADYARFVEFGTRSGVRGGNTGVADADFFTAEAGANIGPGSPRRYNAGARDRRQYRTHPGTPAQPFFWPSVREELPNVRASMNRLAIEVGREEGF